jgi:N-methylhydantoinase A
LLVCQWIGGTDSSCARAQRDVLIVSRRAYRIGIDVGGTFTKAALVDNATHAVVGRSSVHTTHDHQEGVAAGVIAVFRQVLAEAEVEPQEVVFLAHSTTQATNALLEGDVAHVGIVGMAGARAAKLARDQSHIAPIELAPGRVLSTSNQFLLSDGLTRAQVEAAVDALIKDGAEVLVASAAFGVDNTSAEELVRDVGKERALPTTCGHEITRLYGLTVRTRTAVINASILPRMIATADMTERSVKAAGIDAPLMIMRGDGGVMDIHEMRRRPAMTMLSGPAASVAGALMHVRMSDGIYFEVGGTSTNIGVIKSGRPAVTYSSVGGHSTYLSSLDVRVLGVAGGSLIQIAAGAVFDVGPRSAHIAGLRYSCFAEAKVFDEAIVVLFEPKAGDGDNFVAIETKSHGRFALTTTCAANALGLTTPEMYCYAPPEAARAAFSPLAAFLTSSIDDVARAVLKCAALKVRPVIEALIKEYQLDEDQRVLIGEGGGVGALLPYVADEMALRYEISKDAEIISSIGAALAMVREVVERINPNPSPDDIDTLRAEAVEAVTRLGADPKTVNISIEVDRHASRIRAIATGSAALRVREERVSISDSDAQQIAAASFHEPLEKVYLKARTSGAFVFGLRGDPKRSVRVVDWEGNVRVQRSHAKVVSATAGNWREHLEGFAEQPHPGASGDGFGGAIALYDRRVIDLTGLKLLSQAIEVTRGELRHVTDATVVILIGFPSGEAGAPFINIDR